MAICKIYTLPFYMQNMQNNMQNMHTICRICKVICRIIDQYGNLSNLTWIAFKLRLAGHDVGGIWGCRMVGRVATVTCEGGPAAGRGRTVNVGLRTDASVTVTVGNSRVTVCCSTIEPKGRNPKGKVQFRTQKQLIETFNCVHRAILQQVIMSWTSWKSTGWGT
jgi:hypothetical protein